MLGNTGFYNFKSNIVLVGGLRISGYDDDGGVEYEFPEDIHSHTATADGHTVISRFNDERVQATITLKETSRGYRLLADLLQQQREMSEGLLEIPYTHKDPIIGDIITSRHTVFLNYPEPTKEREAGNREFQLLLPEAASNIEFGLNN